MTTLPKFLEPKLDHIRACIGNGFVSEEIRYRTDSKCHLIIDDHFQWAYLVYDQGVYDEDFDLEEVDYDEAVEKYFS